MCETVECPNCLGEGVEILKWSKGPQNCSLCKGKQIVSSELSSDYITSINVHYDEVSHY